MSSVFSKIDINPPLPLSAKNLKNINRKVQGFTLIELLIVISIMVLIFSLGYANYRSFQRRQHLEGAVRMIKADLRLAQEMALAGRKPVGCDRLHGYLFRAEPPDRYSLGAFCDTNETCQNTPANCIRESIRLPEGINISPIGAGNSFYFRVLARGIDRSSNVTISLSFPGSGVSTKTVVVTPAGEIR